MRFVVIRSGFQDTTKAEEGGGGVYGCRGRGWEVGGGGNGRGEETVMTHVDILFVCIAVCVSGLQRRNNLNTHTHAHAHTHACTHARTHARIHTHARTHAHTHTHTHTH